jgi:hypothetical protein
MKRALFLLAPALLWAGLSPSPPSGPGDLTGDWHLNVAKSRWGSMNKPHSVVVRIEHKEPAFSYYGEIQYANEDTRSFAFDGAIDGKSYPVTRSYGPGTMVLKRLETYSIESVYRSDSGLYTETTRTSVSRDGKLLTRRLRLQSPDGVKTWTEIYERR